MAAPVYTLILTPNGSKKAWLNRKIPQIGGFVFAMNKIINKYIQYKNKNLSLKQRFFRNLKYSYIINMHVCNTTKSLKYKKRRIRRRRTEQEE
jgi:hypothetical protein